MNSFKFKQVEHTFRWESDFLALEFSNPSIQGFSEFVNLSNEKEIMYYYYTVKVFKKNSFFDDEDNEVSKMELICKRNTHDFPSIFQLKWLLNDQLQDNSIVGKQKIEYASGDVRYKKVMATDGFACDDFYEITKSVDATGSDEQYIVYCGTTFDSQGDLNSVGIRTPYVSRKDIEELVTCVNSFIDYSMEKHNNELKVVSECYEVKEKKIYEYAVVNENIDRNVIESMYAEGDNVCIKTVINNQEQDYENVGIVKVEGDDVILDTNQRIQGNSIVYISNEPTEKMLHYKEREIANEFINILSIKEKNEFQQETLENLVAKYKMAIINRTWMCRDEHGFNMDYHSGDNIKAVIPIVKDVIHIIKETLSED